MFIKQYLPLLLILCLFHLHGHAQAPSDYVIPVKVEVSSEGEDSIILWWPENADATAYTIKRKEVTNVSYKDSFALLAVINNSNGAVNKYTDVNIQKSVPYEYEISATYNTSLPGTKSTYICAGKNIPAVHNRGSIILLCDSSVVTDINTNLQRLYADLVGDGWKIIRIDVNGSTNPLDAPRVKSKIQQAYNHAGDVKQLLIIGHVAVPYSGNIGPDGHSNHIGAWPADGYYGAMQGGTWTDLATYSFVSTTRAENKNLPGDGKFDQDSLPPVQVAVGRIDFSNLPVFSTFETELLNRYLSKNHAFRHGQIIPQRRALIEDNLSSFAEKFSQSGWKSFASTVGYDNVQTGQYETWLLWPYGYLWSYGCGGGTYTGAGGIGNSSMFVTDAYNTVFTQLFGSYFGDWDTQDNYMRSALAGPGNTLACVWGARPHWYFHNMSAGMPIGYSALLTMNNKGVYKNTGYGNANVHIGLMGDPSLRSSYIQTPQAFFAQANQSKVDLLWTRANENNVSGYYLYRSNSITGTFTLLNDEPITALQFTDSTPLNGNNVYMVRTAKMDTIVTAGNYTNNSTYLNLSQGLFDSVEISVAAQAPVISLQQLGLAAAPKQVVIVGTGSKRYFVGQKNGDVKLYDDNFNLLSTYLSAPGINEGFFSLAFSPNFAGDKLLYAFYTNQNGDLELARFKENANSLTASQDGVVLAIPNPGNSKNLGGEIHFGTDGSLYISTGDGDTKNAAANNAQNNQSLLGKILRIRPASAINPASAYIIPASNPYGNEVYISGLRLPYRWGFDKLTNEMWVGDRGDSSIEEINRISFSSSGATNFGWPCYEGTNTFNSNGCGAASNYQFPVYQYSSPDKGKSVTGGTVYRGETFIALKGYYIFADENNSKIYLSKFDSVAQAYTTVSQFLAPGAISDISEDSDGELYATSLLGGVYRIVASGPKLYRFSGNGNWDNANNWKNKTIPPAPLPFGSEIVISPANNGECILNVPQTIAAGAKITVEGNKRFRIMGNLTINQ